MSSQEIDLTRVLCSEAEVPENGSRGFKVPCGDWPLSGLLVRTGGTLRGYVNRCPHAGHPLNLLPDQFLTPDGALILCRSHGALFDKDTGVCVAGPCAGRSLVPVPLKIHAGLVMLADEVDPVALADAPCGSGD